MQSKLPSEKKSLNWSRMKNIIEKMFSPSTILGSLVFISHLDLFSLLQPHLHEQIVLHSDTPASRYSTVSFGSHSQINTTWTRRHKQLSSASSSSSSSTYAVWGIVLLASTILKDFHISQKVTLSPWIKHPKIHKKEIFSCNSFFLVQLLPTEVLFACEFKTNAV